MKQYLFCLASLLFAVSAAHAERQTITINTPVEIRNFPSRWDDNRDDVRVQCFIFTASTGGSSIGAGEAMVPVDAQGNYRGTVSVRIDIASTVTDDTTYRCSLGTPGAPRLLDLMRRNGYVLQSGVSQVDEVEGRVWNITQSLPPIRNIPGLTGASQKPSAASEKPKGSSAGVIGEKRR